MCNNETFNQQVLKYAFNPSGFNHDTICPDCGKVANVRDYDSLVGGSINPQQSISCGQCGYHKCDDEFCQICEDNAEEQNYPFEMLSYAYVMAESFEDKVSNGKSLLGSDVTSYKLLLHKYSECVCIDASITIRETMRLLLELRFKHRLELKIEAAKAIK